MPYVLVPSPSQDKLLESAQRRWDQLVSDRPDLEPAVELQRDLLVIVLGVMAKVGGGRLPRLSLPPKYLAAKLLRGVPVFAGEPIPLPVALLKTSLLSLCGALAEGGAGDVARHIGEALDNGSIEPGSLLTASLARDQGAIRTGASHRGLAPDLVWLIAELAVGPVACALQQTLLGSRASDDLNAALQEWRHGYCPACGSWPALAEVVSGRRTLRCSFCATAWEPRGYACVYCGESGKPFVTAAPNDERKDRRVELCSACGNYLKTVDVPELSPFPLLAIADLETMDLDVAAMEHGFARPALKDVSRLKA